MTATRTHSTRHVVALLAAGAFGIAAPLTVSSLSDAAVQRPSHVRDSDGDKMPDRWEAKHGLDAHKANARKDADRDGLKNLTEFRDGTDPQDDDSDDDGVEDGDDATPDGDCAVAPATQGHDTSDDCDQAGDCDDDATDDSGDDSGDDSATNSSDDECDAVTPARVATYVV